MHKKNVLSIRTTEQRHICYNTGMDVQTQSLPHAVKEAASLPARHASAGVAGGRPPAKNLKDALSGFGFSLVMKASDECHVLPHILHLIGKGGEHVVFEDVRFPNYVFKVDFIESLPVLYAQPKGTDAVDEAVAALKEKAAKHHERLVRLQKYFLPGTVPLEMVAVKNVPLDEEVVVTLLKDRQIEVPKNLSVPAVMPVLCSIQRKISLPKAKVDIYSSYAELNRTILPEFYGEGHRLLSGSEVLGPTDYEKRKQIISYIYPSLKKIAQKLEEDADFKSMVTDYIRRAMRYSADTDEIIDMAGGGNVVFFTDEEGRWQCFLMDSLSPPELKFDLIKKAALLIKHGEQVDVRMRANTLNVINYVRFANALAMLCNTPERLDVDGMKEVTAEQWRQGLIIEKYLDVYTPKRSPKAQINN